MRLQMSRQPFKVPGALLLWFLLTFALLEAAPPSFETSNIPGPDTVPNPLPLDAVNKIQSVIVGKYAATGDYRCKLTTADTEIKIIEIIADPYRLGELKKSLATSTLRKKYRRAALGGDYSLIFRDKDRNVVAAASFY